MGREGICVWDGDCYALAVTERPGVGESDGLAYSTMGEVIRLLIIIDEMTVHTQR
jgi:hypothetical protein